MRKIKISATHGRGGWTRYAGETLEVAEEGPSGPTIMTGHDAIACVGEGLGAWENDDAGDEAAAE